MEKGKERIVIRNGKPIYAIRIDTKEGNNNTYVYIENGKIYFNDSYFSTNNDFDFSDESHKIAKEIFISEIQTDVKRRILELKQLEEIFISLNMKDLLDKPVSETSKGLLGIVADKLKGGK